MERNAEQLAWSVLIAAFAIFCALLVSIPKGIDTYLGSAMAAQPVRLDLIRGTVLWLPSGGRQEVNATNRQSVGEGEQVRTTPDTEGLLSFFDGSNVRLWPNTSIEILRSQSSAFREENTELALRQSRGHARYEVAIPATATRRFEVETPHATILLREGSYKVEVGDEGTIVTVTAGSATVSAQHQAVEALRGEWTRVLPDSTPAPPTSNIHNLLENGDFADGLAGWQPGTREADDAQPGQALPRQQDSRTYVEFYRADGARPSETFLHRSIGEDVADYGVLKLNFQIRLVHQRLSDAGALRVEFPLLIRVRYRDSSGNESTWMRGYALAAPSNTRPQFSPNFREVQPDLWVDESIDLLDPRLVSPRPAEILWIEFAANGQGYSSDVANAQLLVD